MLCDTWAAMIAPTPASSQVMVISVWQLDWASLTAIGYLLPQVIFYATTSLRKIGYWRYIASYRHLQQASRRARFPDLHSSINCDQDENHHAELLRFPGKASRHRGAVFRARFCDRFFILPCSHHGMCATVSRKESTRASA